MFEGTSSHHLIFYWACSVRRPLANLFRSWYKVASSLSHTHTHSQSISHHLISLCPSLKPCYFTSTCLKHKISVPDRCSATSSVNLFCKTLIEVNALWLQCPPVTRRGDEVQAAVHSVIWHLSPVDTWFCIQEVLAFTVDVVDHWLPTNGRERDVKEKK